MKRKIPLSRREKFPLLALVPVYFILAGFLAPVIQSFRDRRVCVCGGLSL